MAGSIIGDPLRHLFWRPAIWSGSTALMDWFESPTSHFIKLNIPGYSRENVKIEVDEDNVLHIKGDGGKEEYPGKDVIFHVAERGGKEGFHRQIQLPDNVKLDQIKAQVDNGVLTIVVPIDNTHKQPKVRTINISSKL